MNKIVGILTLHRNVNYGANLQAFASRKFLEENAFDAFMIDYLPAKQNRVNHLWGWLYESWENDTNRSLIHKAKLLTALLLDISWKHRRLAAFARFRRNYLRCTSYCATSKDISDLGIKTVVCGSDQVWNPAITNGIDPVFFGEISGVSTRISYAASVGKDHYDAAAAPEAARLIKALDYCSVREENTREYAKKISNREVKCVCDPVFLLQKTAYMPLVGKNPVHEKYLLLYSIVSDEKMLYIAKKYALEHHLKLVEICAGQPYRKSHKIVPDIGPDGFLTYFYYADAIITNSFHGTAFSIIFEKNFYVINNRSGGSRITNLLEKSGLQSRMIETWEEITDLPIDYVQAAQSMKTYIDDSKRFLLDALTVEKRPVIEKNCTGCGACESICPRNAIRLFPNFMGFRYAVIDDKKCVDCKKCLQVCPEHNPVKRNTESPEVFAFKGNDEIRMASTSGGAFSALAKIVLNQGGVVYATTWRDKHGNVEHSRCDSTKSLPLLRGVKYVQSDFSSCYHAVEGDLLNGKTVLVTGTPCQIAGIRQYLELKHISTEKLLLADIICHGIPSPDFFKAYWKWLEEKYQSAIKEYRFRDKRISWRNASCSVLFENGRRVENSQELCSYLNVYYSGNITRESCFECQYASTARVSDLTISDYWGIEKLSSGFEDALGVSMLLINSPKGKIFLDRLEGVRISGKLETAKQPQLHAPCKRPAKREIFEQEYQSHKIAFLLKKYGGFLSISERIKHKLYHFIKK